MTKIQQILSGSTVSVALAAATFALPARAEIIPVAQMLRGVTMSQAQCAAQASAVWVVVARQGYCIRYYLSTAGGQGTKPVILLDGDKLGAYNPKTETFSEVDKEDVDTALFQRGAELISKMTGTTAIYIGRPGVDGSSGFHGYRGSWLELYIIHSALSEIRRKLGFEGFHLVGQSGGAGITGGLLILRDDIGCAVPGAGRLALLDDKWQKNPDPLLRRFDAYREVGRIALRRSTRILVITDPEDKRVEAKHQTTFANALRRAGGRVEQYYVIATDELRHGVLGYALRAVTGCIKNEDQAQIHAALMKVQERRLAAAQQRRQQSAGGTPPRRG